VIKLRFEIWQEDSGGASTATLCLVGPMVTSARRLNEPGARLLRTFEAESFNDAAAIRNRLMGWG